MKHSNLFIILCLTIILLSACSQQITPTTQPSTPVVESSTSVEDTTSPNDTIINTETEVADVGEYVIGETTRFGGYNWIVLDIRDDKVLLLTEDIISFQYGNISDTAYAALSSLTEETMPFITLNDFEDFSSNNPKFDGLYNTFTTYKDENPDIFTNETWGESWEDCSLRAWLNNGMGFTDNEWDQIVETEIVDATDGGSNTSDKVFLLDYDSVQKYFPQNDTRGATSIASDEDLLVFLQHGALMGTLTGKISQWALSSRDDGVFYWWVRGSSPEDSYLEPMSTDEQLRSMASASTRPLGVRPAIWLSIEG
ncbi:DUF6273 domain-containing protein [Bengtsoniella intestinalis]|uniref:DUF6273 domain-containing protein n=1 Tax=Bengtsoniella intestinalis TaxID=3073143 RepID=UPI00391F0BEE